MAPIRIYSDPWNGALHARRTPAGLAAKGLRTAGEPGPDSPRDAETRATHKGARDLSRWLEGPVR